MVLSIEFLKRRWCIKKLGMGIFLSGVVVICFMFVSAVPEAECAAFKESFEIDSDGDGVADGWTTVGNPKIAVTYSLDTEAQVGRKSQKIEVTDSSISEQAGIYSRYFNLNAGQNYKVDFWYKTAGLADTAVYVFIGWYDEGRKTFESFPIIKRGKADEWEQVTTFLKLESNVRVTIHMRLWVWKPGGNGTVWFDDVKVELQEEANPTSASADLGQEPVADSPRKKLIKCGWDMTHPDFVCRNIRNMEKRPFDGIIFRLGDDHNLAFDTRAWDEISLQSQFEYLRKIEWQTFTDNFIHLYATNSQGMNWFNDNHWKVITDNLRLVVRAAKIGRCVGLSFDTESYGPNPWMYTAGNYPTKTFGAVAAMVRRRGAQFITALQGEMPEIKLLSFHQLGYFGENRFVNPGILDDPNPERRERLLSQDSSALLPAFFNGILDAAGSGVTLIDGNENSYFYRSSEEFYKGYHVVKQRVLSLVAPENQKKYRAQVQAGQAIWQTWCIPTTSQFQTLGHFLASEDRVQYLEHQVYYALQTTDKYAWFYTDKQEWWRDPVPAGRMPVVEGSEQAILSARIKVEQGKPLGFSITNAVRKATEKKEQQEAAAAAGLVKRNATIVRLLCEKPRIDGVLDDVAWKNVNPLESFLPAKKKTKEKTNAGTTVRVTYDNQYLYIAFECHEPQVKKMSIIGEKHDDDIWKGDVVEVFVSTGESLKHYRHFIVNPKNIRWDEEVTSQGHNVAWDADWQSEVRIGSQGWMAELAIQWDIIGGFPEAGTKRFINVCRNRKPVPEITSWSQVYEGFQEPDRFGIWTFGDVSRGR